MHITVGTVGFGLFLNFKLMGFAHIVADLI